MKKLLAGLAGLVALTLADAGPAQQASLATPFETSSLVIVGDSGRHGFTVELAVTPEQRARGLMFRRALAPDAGMLFDFGPRAGRASMWMKNTYIPLDMLFIAADGTVVNIARWTTPQSLDVIKSQGDVLGVLEVNAGTADRLKIRPGDKVLHRIFGNR